MPEQHNKKLKIITTSNEGIRLKNYKEDYYIYSGNTRVRNSLRNSIYKPIKCSELYYKINKSLKWFQYKYVVVKDNNFYIVTKKLSDEYRNSTIYETNPKDLTPEELFSMTENNDFISNKTWSDLLDTVENNDKDIIEKMINSNEIFLLNNSKSVVDFLSDNTITTELIEPNTYTDTVDLKPILSEKLSKNKGFKLDISIKYSINEGNPDLDGIYCYDTTINGISFNKEKVEFNNFIQTIGNNQVKLEYLKGIIKVFPLSDKIKDCIISNCLITYGQ